jgi:hypothetical protein
MNVLNVHSDSLREEMEFVNKLMLIADCFMPNQENVTVAMMVISWMAQNVRKMKVVLLTLIVLSGRMENVLNVHLDHISVVAVSAHLLIPYARLGTRQMEFVKAVILLSSWTMENALSAAMPTSMLTAQSSLIKVSAPNALEVSILMIRKYALRWTLNALTSIQKALDV